MVGVPLLIGQMQDGEKQHFQAHTFERAQLLKNRQAIRQHKE